ncbi:hypothetical protein ACWKSR_11015, partial [Campylobacter fetus subsp. venerealis]
RGSQNVTLPNQLTITGDMTQSGSGQFLMDNTHITFSGVYDQEITGFLLCPQDLTVAKSGGEVLLAQNLNVQRNLTMLDGKLNFQDNTLAINTSNAGSMN